MPAAPIKTYEFTVNQFVAGDGTQTGGAVDATNDRKGLLLGIVDALIDGGTFTTPWVVQGSSNGTAAGMDGVNRWSSISDLTWVVGTFGSPAVAAHSWIVLFQPALGVHLLIECVNTSNADGHALVGILSATGFGVANGGTDGNTIDRPTATNEAVLRTGENSDDGAWSGTNTGGARDWRYHVMGSTDGEVWNVIGYNLDVCTQFWRFERPTNPPAGWTSPIVAAMLGRSNTASNAEIIQGFVTLDPVRRPGAANGLGVTDVHAFTWGWEDSASNREAFGRAQNVHPVSGLPVDYEITWYTESAGIRGRLGRATDLWRKTGGGTGGAAGDTIPSNPATPNYLVVGTTSETNPGHIVPWDGVTAPLTS